MVLNRSIVKKIAVLALVLVMTVGAIPAAAGQESGSGLPDRFSIVLFGLSGDKIGRAHV